MTSRTTGITLRGIAAFCTLATAAIHLLLIPSHLKEIPHVGVLFLVGSFALRYTSGDLARRNPNPAWLIGALVNIGMFVGFLLSRTIGLPGYREDDWELPYGPLSLIIEGVFVLAFMAWINGPGAGAPVVPKRPKVPSSR